MKHKIVKVKAGKTSNEVLIYMTRNSDYGDSVKIQAWHNHEDSEYLQEEEIVFPNDAMSKRFVAEFSEVAANEFIQQMTF